MQYATLFGALCAAGLAAAAPLQDRAVVYDYVYDTVVVTVTDTVPAATQAPAPAYTPTPAYTPPARIPVSSSVVVSLTPAYTPPASSYTPPASPKSSVPVAATPDANTVNNVVSTAQSSTHAYALPTDFVSTALYHHNIHRANHSVSDMTYNDTLAGYAATVAAKCVFAHDQ